MLLENGPNKSEQYLANVALKLNVKLGGKNHIVSFREFANSNEYLIVWNSLILRICNGSGRKRLCWSA